MCEFVSWVEKGDKVYFLTHDLIHSTPRGEIIQKRFQGVGEPLGHSAIRAYFEIDGGRDKECTDFSTPDNFPEPIAEAIKNGEMRGFGCPKGLLLPRHRIAWMARCKALDDDYWARIKALDADYEAKRKPSDDDYMVRSKTLADNYLAKRKTLNDEYWDLFAKPENRNPAWV